MASCQTLNKRLQLGPQAPKKEEAPEDPVEEKEKTPLVDARKGRARGPARRAPAKSPAPASAAVTEKPTTNLAFSMPSTLWQIDPDDDSLQVPPHYHEVEPYVDNKATTTDKPTLATNITGQALPGSSEITEHAEKASSPLSPAEKPHVPELEQDDRTAAPAKSLGNDHEQEPAKTSNESPVLTQTLAPLHAEEEDLSTSTATLKPSTPDLE